MPVVKLWLVPSLSTPVGTPCGGFEPFAKIISDMMDNKIPIRAFAAGEIVPGLRDADAIQNPLFGVAENTLGNVKSSMSVGPPIVE